MGFQLSTCPYCSCGCGLLLQEEGHRLIGTHPSSAHPISRGSLCIRGWNCTTARNHPDRLRAPWLRQDGRLVETSPREAVHALAARLRAPTPSAGQAVSPEPPRVLFAVGPAVANEDAWAIRRLAGSIGAGVCPTDLSGVTTARASLARVLGRRYVPASLDVVADADLVWMFGVDPEEYPQFGRRLTQAARRGASIVEFDVFRKPAPGSTAISVPVPPGEFATAALLLQQTLFNLARPAARVIEAPGFHPAATAWQPGRAPFIRDHPWLPDDQARGMVTAMLGAARGVAVVGNRWLTSSHSLFHTVRLLEALALAGLDDRLLVLTGESNSWGTADLLPPTDEARALLLDLMDPGGSRRVSTLVVVGDDLVARSSRPSAMVERLAALETLAVVDRFRTKTSEVADVVLPAAAFGELDGTVTNCFGTVQRWRQAVAPPGESLPEREWMARLAGALGLDGWPETPLEWVRDIQRGEAGYSRHAVESLYAADAPFGVPLHEDARLTFSPVGNPPAADRHDGFPLELVFGAHPAVWSTGAVSGREELLRREVADESVRLSPADVTAAGFRPGQRALVVTAGGEAELTIHGDDRLPPGVGMVLALPGGPGSALRGFYRDWDGRTLDLQPVPARLGRG